MWLEDDDNLASETYSHPVRLLPIKVRLQCYSAPVKELSDLVDSALSSESERSELALRLLKDRVVAGQPGVQIPEMHLRGFRNLRTWPEVRVYLREWPDSLPREWQWDASLVVYDISSALRSVAENKLHRKAMEVVCRLSFGRRATDG